MTASSTCATAEEGDCPCSRAGEAGCSTLIEREVDRSGLTAEDEGFTAGVDGRLDTAGEDEPFLAFDKDDFDWPGTTGQTATKNIYINKTKSIHTRIHFRLGDGITRI